MSNATQETNNGYKFIKNRTRLIHDKRKIADTP